MKANTAEIVKYEAPQVAKFEQIPVAEVAERRRRIVELMQTAMQKDVDFGVIPGCAKPTLLQPGAQKINNLFQLDPEFEREPDSVLEKEFILHSYRCTLFHIPTQLRVASGVGSCNSREEKYGMRNAGRKCPECGKQTIIAGKQEYGGGFLCFKKKGGCGVKFHSDDPAITGQPEGKIPNDNIWEQENTIRKMAQKRALIAATLNATGASDIFTQDVEDMAEFAGGVAQDARPDHREGKVHHTSFCAECRELNMPEGCEAVLHKGHLYLKDANGDPVDHEAFCPNEKCKELREQDPQQEVRPAPQPLNPPSTDAPACPKCNGAMKLVPAGISKTGKKYGAFYGCKDRNCGGSAKVEKKEKQPEEPKQTDEMQF